MTTINNITHVDQKGDAASAPSDPTLKSIREQREALEAQAQESLRLAEKREALARLLNLAPELDSELAENKALREQLKNRRIRLKELREELRSVDDNDTLDGGYFHALAEKIAFELRDKRVNAAPDAERVAAYLAGRAGKPFENCQRFSPGGIVGVLGGRRLGELAVMMASRNPCGEIRL